jgi:peptide/nickel transport system permease protein
MGMSFPIARPHAGLAAPKQMVEHEPRPRARVRLTPGGVVGLAVFALLLFTAFLAPHIDHVDPAHQALRARLVAPIGFSGTWAHPLGTDNLGRDLLARTIAGARVSLLIGVVATLVAGAIGVALGLLAGFFGGWVDRIVSFLADVQLALPFVVVAIALVATLGPSIRNVVIVLAVTGWVGYARILRLQTMSLRQAPFIGAARAMGASPARIILRHLAPNLIAPIIVIASQQVAAMILFEAALSYLGLGAGSGTITWGGMISAGRETMLTAWWVAVIPGAAVALTILGLNLLGDWLRGVMDPTTRGR